jgi:hypothetical protein
LWATPFVCSDVVQYIFPSSEVNRLLIMDSSVFLKFFYFSLLC